MTPAADAGGALPAPVDVTPDDINAAAQVFAAQQTYVLLPLTATLAGALLSNGGMAGNDGPAHTFAASYDPAAAAAMNVLNVAAQCIGSIALALNTTANNYVTADARSASGGPPPALYEPVDVAVFLPPQPAPPSSIGPGTTGMPGFIAKYWPNGHQDMLRTAGTAWSTAATSLQDMAYTLHGSVTALASNNSSASVTAMSALWSQVWAPDGSQGCLGAAYRACAALGNACSSYANAIDSAHSQMENALGSAGIAIGVTTAAGGLLTLITGGASDVLAGMLDAEEAETILGPLAEEFAEAVAGDTAAAIGPDLVPALDAASASTPVLDTVEAETTQVDNLLEEEMAEEKVPARVGGGDGGDTPGGGGSGGDGGGGGEPPDGGGSGDDDQPETPQEILGNKGKNIGVPGDNKHVRIVQTEQELQELYDGLSEGGTEFTPPNYNGKIVRLPDGTTVGIRYSSSSGGPALEIRGPNKKMVKVHIVWPPTP